MDKITQSVELPKDAKELADGLVAFVAAVATALKDGFQVGTDLPPIISAAVVSLVPHIAQIQAVGGDFSEMPAETAYVFAKAGLNIVAAIKA